MEKDQLNLGFIEEKEIWEQEWVGMPEYLQENQDPVRTIYIHFRTEEDVEDFEKVIGQKIYPKDKSYWHPVRVPRKASLYRWIDKDSEDES